MNVMTTRAWSTADRADGSSLPWIERAPHAPYFMTETGEPWHPIGQNDAISWVELDPLFRRRDMASVEAHLTRLRAHGVTVLRLMLEYAQVRHRYLERPVGHVPPNMLLLWDDLFALCERVGMRILLTPFDTFWMWLKFRHHPYNRLHGGPLAHPSELLLCPATLEAVKWRLSFATRRWGGSGVIFAWDLWNEIHPAQAGESAEPFVPFIAELSRHVRAEEIRLHGRSHLQTVSLFGPELRWRAHLRMEEAIFRHPALDAATLHVYEEGTIDHPPDTVAPAIAMGRIVRDCLAEIVDGRPFFDSEHGPIHTFKDRKRTLPADFDDACFRHMSWAHLAAGGAGGGMRWPNRTPHVLTPGMRRAQAAMAAFLPCIDWLRFDRACISDALTLRLGGAPLPEAQMARFGCGTGDQAIVYLLRRDTLDRRGLPAEDAEPIAPDVHVPGLRPGTYRLTAWSTREGIATAEEVLDLGAEPIRLPPFVADTVIALQRIG